MDLSMLRPLYDQPGPWATVYLDTSRDTEDARAAVALRWRAVKESLAGDGADPATIEAIDRTVAEDPGRDHAGDRGLAVFASSGQVHFAVPLPDPPRDEAVVSVLPQPLGLVLNLPEHVPWLLVVADRTGADLLAVDARGPRQATEVTGEAQYPLRKAAPGGWSQPRYQRAAEENWEHNADQVARAAADLADEVRAEVLVLAGDVRARQLVRDHLPERVTAWVDVIETDAGGRAPGAAREPLEKVTEEAVRAKVGQHHDDLLDAYRRDLGTGGAVAGLVEVSAALRRGGVRVLLIDRDRPPAESLWAASDPRQVATLREEIPDDRAFRAPATAALIRAAVGERADVMAVTAEDVDLPDGVGAVLRYAQPEGSVS